MIPSTRLIRIVATSVAVILLGSCSSAPMAPTDRHPIIGAWELDQSQADSEGIILEMTFRADGTRVTRFRWEPDEPILQDLDHFRTDGQAVFLVQDGDELELLHTFRDGKLILMDEHLPGALVLRRKVGD